MNKLILAVVGVMLIGTVVFFSGCIEESTCDTCNGETDDTNHPAYHAVPNSCGAHVYAYPDFPEDHPYYGEGCDTSEQCWIYPPDDIPDADLCCSVEGDNTCYRETEQI